MLVQAYCTAVPLPYTLPTEIVREVTDTEGAHQRSSEVAARPPMRMLSNKRSTGSSVIYVCAAGTLAVLKFIMARWRGNVSAST